MEINIYKIIAIIGLISIIIGTFMISLSGRTKRKYIYPLLLIGGTGLLIYSIYINDIIFIILQTAYILIVVYDIIKLKNSKK
ncbi:hypothetical protein HYS72_02035 [Candidatus Pacearchaeota archaeon]|nr:hypothetical protein [Candidatus Pacearchaeota archaeon]MBI2056908.1 hypothetical protein [Candidatus Pacearchaeota archaeon]